MFLWNLDYSLSKKQPRIHVILITSAFPNLHRLVELCLLEDEGALQLAKELGVYQSEDTVGSFVKPIVSRVAQLVASVPDKIRLGAPKSLSSQYPFIFI